MTSINTPATESIRARIVQITSKASTNFEEDADQILREFAVLHRSEETITEDADGVVSCGSGHELSATVRSRDPKTIRNRAANLIALAEYLEGQEAKDNARNKRRDELAAEFSFGAYAYGNSSPAMQSAVDRIIELEAAL